jgi:hypothetical protein
MDPEYLSDDDGSAAMAAAMGFASFGTQGPPKKRKFNPAVDAFVEGQDLEKIDRGGKKGQGSGGNNIPLGKVRVLGAKVVDEAVDMEGRETNEEEIHLDMDDDEEEDGAAVTAQDGEVEDVPSHYIDTSLPPPTQEAVDAQARIDAILAASESAAFTPAAPQPRQTQKQKQKPKPAPTGLAAYLSAMQSSSPHQPSAPPGVPLPQSDVSLPQRPAAPPSTVGSTASGFSHGRGQRERNEFWYKDYYDPSFNENPWKTLEAERGMPEAPGRWVERPQRGGQPA